VKRASVSQYAGSQCRRFFIGSYADRRWSVGMRRTRIAAISAAAALAAAGTGVAVATSRPDDAKQREQAVLSDAAKRLDVSPSELRDALAAAQDDQLDADVKAGRLTQEQADAIKAHRNEEASVLGGPGVFLHHRGGPDFPRGPGRGPGDILKAAAGALGISQAKLIEQLRDGKSLDAVAKANGKSFADVKAAIRTATKKELDAAVKAGRFTQAQADDMLERLTEHLDDFGLFGGPREFHRGPDGPGAPPPPGLPGGP